MKLDKTLDLSKCFYDKAHWTHPDLKEGQLYIVYVDKDWLLVRYEQRSTCDIGLVFWQTISRDVYPLGFTKDRTPFQEGWKHIQEVVV